MQNSHFFKIEKESSEKCSFCNKLLWTTPDLDSTLGEAIVDKYACPKTLNV